MKLALAVLGVIIVALVLCGGIVALLGSRLPRMHTASRSMVLHQTPEDVYKVVRDFGKMPEWRLELKRVEVEDRPGEGVRFREESKSGTVNYEVVEDIPAQRLVTRILDTNLGYSGKWTYTFAPEGNGTRVSITEDGEVSNILFRFMSRYIFGHTATIDAYLRSLAKRFGEDVVPQ